MGITIPGYLQWVSYLAGQEWPQGDETAMFRIGDDWGSSAGELKDLIPDLNRVRSETESMFTGQTAEKVDQEFAKLFDGDYSVDKLAEAMSALGDLAQGCGTEIEYTKLQIIATLAIAAAEIGFALAASPETFGGSLAAIPGIEALTMAAVRQLVSQLLKNIVEHLAEAGLKTMLKRLAVHVMADGLGQELAIQGFQIAEGHRHGLDAKQLANAELSALAGGLAAAPVSRGVGHALGLATGKVSGAIKGGVSGYAGGVAGNIAGTAATGGPMNAASILGGALPGGLSGGVHGGRDGHGGGPDHGAGADTRPAPERPAAPESNGSRPPVYGDTPSTRTDPSALHGTEPTSPSPPHETAPPAHSSDGLKTEGPAPEQTPATQPPNGSSAELVPDARQAPAGPAAGDPSPGAASPGPGASTATPPTGNTPASSSTPPSHSAPTERPTSAPSTRASLSDPSSAPTSGRPEGSPVAHTSDATADRAPTARETSEAPRSPSGPETARRPIEERPNFEPPARRTPDDRPSPEQRRDAATDTPRPSAAHDQARDARASTDPAQPTRRGDQPNSDATRTVDPKRIGEPRTEETATRPTSQSGHSRSEHDGSQRPDADRHPDPVEPHDMSVPPFVVAPTLPGLEPAASHGGSAETRAVPADRPTVGAERSANAGSESTKPAHQAAMAKPPEEIHLDPGGPSGGGPTDPPHFDNPSNHRIFGPHELRRLEDPAYHHAVEAALRDPRGGYTLHADPRTHPYGDLINDGGTAKAGRNNNCLDCSLAALASFHGHPTVAVPRWFERLQDGTISRSGEASGLARAGSWLGAPLRPTDWHLPVGDQFDALHDQIARMGPGSSALVVNTWHGIDGWGRPLFYPDGSPVLDGTHATVVVYPHDATGPVWWDPQRRLTSDHPPHDLVGRSAYLHFTEIPPNHFSSVLPEHGGHSDGTEHTSRGTGIPGDDRTGSARPVSVRDGLGVHPEVRPGRTDTEPNARTGEAGDRFPDRGRDGTSESVASDDRGGVRGSEALRPARRSPDLPPSVEDRSPTHPRGPGDHRVPDDRGFADRATGADRRTPDHGGQSEPVDRTSGQPLGSRSLTGDLGQSTEPRGLARAGHDGVLDDHGHQLPPPGSGHDGDVSHLGDHQPDDSGERWREIQPFHDAEHAHDIANDALIHRIPPTEAIDLRHPLGDVDLARQRAVDNAHWWHELSGEQQRALIDAYPHELGNAEGIPPAARHEANSSVLEHDRSHLQSRKDAGDHLSRSERKDLTRLNNLHDALEKARDGAAKLGGDMHILAFDRLAFHGEGRMVVSVGHDPYRAESVSWHVPGLTTTIDSLPANLENALHHLQSTQAQKPGIVASSIAWIGYDAPSGRGIARVLFQGLAREGGAILHSDVSAFNAGRDVAAGDGSRFRNNHIFGHSYGSTTTGHAGRDGRMGGDVHTVTLLGSPGIGPQRHASNFNVGDHVYVGSSSRDFVTMLGGRTADSAGRFFGHGLGMDPAMREFGAHRITSEFPRHMDRADTVSTHTAYYTFDPESGHRAESLANFGRIAAGNFDGVHSEPHRTVDDRPRWIPGWRTDEPAMGRPLEDGSPHPDSLDRRPWDPRWHSGYAAPTDPVHSRDQAGDGWHRIADRNDVNPQYGQPLPKHWTWPDNPTATDRVSPGVLPLVHDRDAPFGRDQDGAPYTQKQYEERFNTSGKDDAHWMNFPGNDGAVPGTKVRFTDIHQFIERYGRSLDRIGDDEGAYLGVMENGRAASWEERALHVNSLAESYSSFTLEHLPAGWEIEISEIAPGLGQPGGGLQVRIFDDAGERKRVRELVTPDGDTRPTLRRGIV